MSKMYIVPVILTFDVLIEVEAEDATSAQMHAEHEALQQVDADTIEWVESCSGAEAQEAEEM